METTIAIIIAEGGISKKYNTVQLHRLFGDIECDK